MVQRAPSFLLKQWSGVILIRSNVILLGVITSKTAGLGDTADKHQRFQMSPIRGENFATLRCF